jgi:hypothetical protein
VAGLSTRERFNSLPIYMRHCNVSVKKDTVAGLSKRERFNS